MNAISEYSFIPFVDVAIAGSHPILFQISYHHQMISVQMRHHGEISFCTYREYHLVLRSLCELTFFLRLGADFRIAFLTTAFLVLSCSKPFLGVLKRTFLCIVSLL